MMKNKSILIPWACLMGISLVYMFTGHTIASSITFTGGVFIVVAERMIAGINQ